MPQVDTEEIAKILANDKDFSEYFSAKVLNEVDKRSIERETSRQRERRYVFLTIGSLLAIFGFFGVDKFIPSVIDTAARSAVDKQKSSIIQEIFIDLNKSVDNAIDKKLNDVTNELNAKIGDLSVELTSTRDTFSDMMSEIRKEMVREFSLIAFDKLASRLDTEDTFQQSDVESVMTQLRALEDSEDVLNRPEFTILLNKILSAFYEAGLSDPLEEIDTLFRSRISKHDELSATMIMFYGEKLLGMIGAPGTWPEKQLNAFEHYSKASVVLNYPEDALPYRVLMAFVQNNYKRSITTEGLLDLAYDMTTDERAFFHVILIQLSNATYWQETTTSSGRTIGRIATAFYSTHENLILEQWGNDDVSTRILTIAQSNPDVLARVKTILEELQSY